MRKFLLVTISMILVASLSFAADFVPVAAPATTEAFPPPGPGPADPLDPKRRRFHRSSAKR